MRPDVFVCFPTANRQRAERAITAWRSRGYKVACLVDGETRDPAGADILVRLPAYPGYYPCANMLARMLRNDVHWLVFAADDMFPDDRDAALIAADCTRMFRGTYGVMQPHGDRLQRGKPIAGSPWIGQEFLQRSYGGNGPFWDGYGQFYGDEELHAVAALQGALWLRPELTQAHEHWMTGKAEKTDYQERNDSRFWDADKATYTSRLERLFPGHEAR